MLEGAIREPLNVGQTGSIRKLGFGPNGLERLDSPYKILILKMTGQLCGRAVCVGRASEDFSPNTTLARE